MTVVLRMATGQLSLRVDVRGRDEYAIMGKAINNMAEKLEKEEKLRDEFVSNVSHEIKTPLTSIKALGDSLLTATHVENETYREFMFEMVSEVDRMTFLTNDLLALVRVGRGKDSLNIEPVEIGDLVRQICKRLEPLANQKDVTLNFVQLRFIRLNTDEMKLTLAISNIIENGIKYTKSGGMVNVTTDNEQGYAIVTVRDTGIGIPEEDWDKIFDRFYRVDKTRNRDTGGTGLGLSISKNTAMLLGGDVHVISKIDEGSTFVLSIPDYRRG